MRTKTALSTIGLLITLTGCGGGETSTAATTTTGGGGAPATTTTGGGGAPATTTTGAGGASVTAGSGGTGGVASSSGTVNPGAGMFGAPCTKNGECVSLLCVDIDATHAVCTKPCANDAACPPAPEWTCGMNGGGSETVCLCTPSGVEICDGQDNNCDGVVDEGGCPELIGTATGPIADLEATLDKLVVLTDKTIETLPLVGGPVINLRSNLVGVKSIAVSSTSIFWIQGLMHKMTFTGLAQADAVVAGGPPYSDVVTNDTVQVYRDASTVYKLPTAGVGAQGTGPMVLAKNIVFWGAGPKILRADVSTPSFTNVVKVTQGQFVPLLLATDGSACYWAGADGAIRKAAPPLFSPPGVDLVTGEAGISGLAADATNVYWSSSDGTTSTLWKLPLAGGAKVKIGGVTGTAHHLIPSGAHLYFETGKMIWRSPT